MFSRICSLNSSSRKVKNVGEIFQVGVPVSSVNVYIKKILNENIKVVLCEQNNVENEKSHYISRIYTKGTILEKEFLDSSENNYILAIKFDNDNSTLAYADVSTGQFYKTKGKMEQICYEVEKILPDEILLLNSQKNKFKNSNFENNITYLDDDEFCGLDSDEILLKYCYTTQKNFFSKLDNIINYNMSKYLTMDEITRINLEISRTKRNLKKKGSLIWFLNQTKTPMGIRLLKKYIDEPLLDVDEIILRQNAVEELLKNKEILNELFVLLQEFSDLSRICAQILNSTIRPKELFSLIRNASTLKKINELCSKFNSNFLRLNQKEIQNIVQFVNIIEDAILDSPADELKNGSIIKDGYNSNLDYLKSKLDEYLSEIEKYSLKLQTKFKNNKIKIDYSRLIGYYIEFPISIQNFAPDDFIKKQTLTNCVRFTNSELRRIEDEILNLKFKINDLEYELFCEVRKMAINFAQQIRNIAKDIARVDVFCSFAKIALEYNFVKPKFNNEKIEIINGYHPSLIKLNNEIVKNDTTIRNGELNILKRL